MKKLLIAGVLASGMIAGAAMAGQLTAIHFWNNDGADATVIYNNGASQQIVKAGGEATADNVANNPNFTVVFNPGLKDQITLTCQTQTGVNPVTQAPWIGGTTADMTINQENSVIQSDTSGQNNGSTIVCQ